MGNRNATFIHSLTFLIVLLSTSSILILLHLGIAQTRGSPQYWIFIAIMAFTFAIVMFYIQSLVIEADIIEKKEENLRNMIQNMPVIMSALDSESKIVAWNAKAEEVTGYKADDVVGHPEIFREFYPDVNYRESVMQSIQKTYADQKACADFRGVETNFACKDKSVRNIVWYNLSARFPIQGWHRWAIGIDITQQKECKEALIRSKKEAETANDQLQKALQALKEVAAKADAANQAKTEFLANMSHEMRTPMSGIIGVASILANTEMTSMQRDYVEMIQKSGESLLLLIDDILDFSKIEAGKISLKMSDFNLRTLVEEISDMMAIKAQEKKLELASFLEFDTPILLRGDQGRLCQILVNLVGNAIKFTMQGEVYIHMFRERQTETDVDIRFEVKDTGIGISKEKIKSLFQPFTQLNSSSTRRFGGSGLGLSICKHLVEMMGGKIGVESKDGNGSLFYFTIPFKKQMQQKTMPDIPPELNGSRILLVDSNPLNLEILGKLLRFCGCVHEDVADSVTTIIKLQEAQKSGASFRAVIINHRLSNINGEDLARKIKEMPGFDKTFLVQIVPFKNIGQMETNSEKLFHATITRPLKQKILYQTLSNLMVVHDVQEEKKKILQSDLPTFGIRILLVEDTLISQKVATVMLHTLGCQVDIAENGKIAIEALTKMSYDLVFMDCQMPEMDGYEATRIIRDKASPVQNHDITVIAMTASALKGDYDKCLKSGMNDYVAKPFKMEELAEVIGRWFQPK